MSAFYFLASERSKKSKDLFLSEATCGDSYIQSPLLAHSGIRALTSQSTYRAKK